MNFLDALLVIASLAAFISVLWVYLAFRRIAKETHDVSEAIRSLAEKLEEMP